MSEKLPENNPWLTLSTVNTFDNGNHSWTTRCVDDSEGHGGGQIVGRVGPSTSLLIESLIQQLCALFEGDTSKRKQLYYAICDRLHEMKLIDNSYNMLELDTVRGQYQIALYKLVTIARASTGSESPIQLPNCLMTEWSRYRREFQEIGFIAAGGFGSVFKALHRLDGNEYAIKKIVVHSGRVKTLMQHLEEVKTIAKLNHTNIVSYKGAWIEPTFPSTFVKNYDELTDYDNRDRESCDASEKNENCPYDESHFSERAHRDENNKTSESNKSKSKISERISERINSRKFDEDLSDIVSFRSETQERKTSLGNDNGTEISNNDATEDPQDTESREETFSEQRICQYSQKRPHQYATLYIQMALCDQTLRQWMDERNQATPINLVTAILQQILCGLEYIHSCGIVHHDIKPSNIFISTSGKLQIQLGDFGLACPLQRDSHPSMLGTPTYAAPEQANGKCDPKSDVYSLGIVLLELLIPMETWMERSRVISALKTGQIPTALATNYPKWAYIISQLVLEDPKKRPSTSELLKNLREDKDSQIAKLMEENQKKNDIIEKLREENKKKDHIIEKVKNENSSIVTKLSIKIAQLESKIRELEISLDNT